MSSSAAAEVRHLISAELAVPVPAEFGLQFQGTLQGKVKRVSLDTPCNRLGGGECGAANHVLQVTMYDDQQRLSSIRQISTATNLQQSEMVLFTYDDQARYPKELFRQYQDGHIVLSTYERDRFGNIRAIRQGDVTYRYVLNSLADGSDTVEPAVAHAGVRRVFKSGREIKRIRLGRPVGQAAGIDTALNTFAAGQTEADIVWGFHPGGNVSKQATAQEILYFNDDPRLLPQARRLRANAASGGTETSAPYVASFWRSYHWDDNGNWVTRERCSNSPTGAAPVCVKEIRDITYF